MLIEAANLSFICDSILLRFQFWFRNRNRSRTVINYGSGSVKREKSYGSHGSGSSTLLFSFQYLQAQPWHRAGPAGWRGRCEQGSAPRSGGTVRCRGCPGRPGTPAAAARPPAPPVPSPHCTVQAGCQEMTLWRVNYWTKFPCTARKIPFMYFFSGNCAASVPNPTFIFMRLLAIYIFHGIVPHIFLQHAAE